MTAKSSTRRSAHYHLRFQILPGPRVAADARALATFCRSHGVEEVVLFFAAEEWNNGLLSRREEDRWFNAVRSAKEILDRAGIVTSLNPWMTVLHCDRGRTFPKDRPFSPTVSPLGEVAKASASFNDPRWRRYVTRLYGRFARLGFRIIWVEDDFRFHNHAPLFWGGGFEQSILDRFSKSLGRKVSRPELVKAILKPGRPHPWRKLWMATWRAIHLEVARELAAAVARNMPGETCLGLMTSGPATHSVEGRRWKDFFAAFSINGKVAHRPHYGPYTEAAGREKPYSVMMLDLQKQFRPAGAESAPEVENFPFTTWAKPDAQTWSEMALCNFFGSDALLLDVFPFSGNQPQADPGVCALLKQSRPSLDWISARFSPDWQTTGVGLPWREDAEERAHLPPGANMYGFYSLPFSGGFFHLNYGIPTCFQSGPVSALFGQVASVLDDSQINALLARGLILDGDSAQILQNRGFGDLLGCEVRAMVDREADSYAVEQIIRPAPGVLRGFYMNANLVSRMALIEPHREAVEWSTLLRPDQSRFGAAMTVFRNRLGGRVVTYATPNPASLAGHDSRRLMAQAAVRFAAGPKWDALTVCGGSYLIPILFRRGSAARLVIYNGGVDPAIPMWEGNRTWGRPSSIHVLAPLGQPQPAKARKVACPGGAGWTLDRPLPHHGFAVCEW